MLLLMDFMENKQMNYSILLKAHIQYFFWVFRNFSEQFYRTNPLNQLREFTLPPVPLFYGPILRIKWIVK